MKIYSVAKIGKEFNTVNVPKISAKCAQKTSNSLKAGKCSSLTPDCITSNPLDPCGGGGGGYVPVYTDHFTDWYKVYPSGERTYTHTQYNGRTVEYIYVSNVNTNSYTQSYYRNYNFYTNGTGGYYSSSTGENITRVYSFLTGRTKCVYDMIIKSNSDLFKETIGQFIDDPKYDLVFRIGNCTNTDTACTDGSNVDTTGEIIITIEDTTQPILELAATILHEAIHAEIFRYVSRFENNLDPNNRKRLLRLYRYYIGLTEIYDNPSEAISDAQHVYMAENFVKPIAEAIRKLDSNKYPLEHYMWYGWEGLEKYDFQNKLTEDLETKYNNYQITVNENTNVKCD